MSRHHSLSVPIGNTRELPKITFGFHIPNHNWRSTRVLYWQNCGQKVTREEEGDLWLPANKLSDCEALDIWINKKTTVPSISYVHSTGPAGSFSPTRYLMHTCWVPHWSLFLFFFFSFAEKTTTWFFSMEGEGINTLSFQPHNPLLWEHELLDWYHHPLPCLSIIPPFFLLLIRYFAPVLSLGPECFRLYIELP